MKKLLTIITLLVLLTGSFFLGRTTAGQPQVNNKIEVIGVYTDIETATAHNFYIEPGEIATEYSDGSYTIVNEEKSTYMFQPATLGDWEYNFDNLDQLNKCVDTYISIAETGQY